jgi:tetratricopeptide (TPR) repeat protein
MGEESHSLAKAAGDPLEEAHGLHLLARLAADRGEHNQAVALLEQALQAFRDLNVQTSISSVLGSLGNMFLGTDPGRAAGYLREAITALSEVDDEETLSWHLTSLAEAEFLLGNCAEARSIVRDAIPLQQAGGFHSSLLYALHLLGWLDLDASDFQGAQTAFKAARQLTHDIGMEQSLLASLLVGLGRVARHIGEVSGAFGFYADAMYQIRDGGLTQSQTGNELVLVLADLLELHLENGHLHVAARLLGAIDALPNQGLAATTSESARRDTFASGLRVTMGDDAFQDAWSAGQQLTAEQVCAEGLELLRSLETRPDA